MSRRILIVEDDAETRAYLAKGLGEAGYLVEATGSGREGLYLATGDGFDAMVLDRMLPDIDGLSLLKSARAAGISTPAILLTAMSATDERVRGLRAGADDYLVKPSPSRSWRRGWRLCCAAPPTPLRPATPRLSAAISRST